MVICVWRASLTRTVLFYLSLSTEHPSDVFLRGGMGVGDGGGSITRPVLLYEEFVSLGYTPCTVFYGEFP